jgi:Mrp family chromosome partitioning ATPase
VLYVVGAGYSEQQDATWAKHLLNNVQANLLGVVMNRMEAHRSREYYYYYARDRKNVRTGT